MRQARPNGFVEYKGHTRHLSAEPVAVILSEAKDLALGAQGKLREESRPGLLGAVCPRRARFLAPLGMTFHGFWAFVG